MFLVNVEFVSLKSIEKLSTKLSKVPIDVILLPPREIATLLGFTLLTGISSDVWSLPQSIARRLVKLRGPQIRWLLLDVIACGFGAVVLLVLILPVGENPSRSNTHGLERIEELKSEISRQLEAERARRLEIASLQGMIAAAAVCEVTLS